jgi:periplasmic divalent cation tolerance protein
MSQIRADDIKAATPPWEPSLLAVVTTVGTLDEARSMARALVERRLAACAQISEIESFYQWEGDVQNEKEFRVLFKTTSARYPEVEDAILQLHSYELPAIHAHALEEVYQPYARWIEDNTTGG